MQCMPQELDRGLVARELTAFFYYFTQLSVHILNSVSNVDHAANLGREHKEREHVFPSAFPGRSDGGIFCAPGALSKGIEGSVLLVPRWLRFRSDAAPEPRRCDLSKICTWRTSPVRWSLTGTIGPA